MTPDIESGTLDWTPAGKLVLGVPLTVRDTTLVPVISVTAGYGKISGGSGGGGGFTLNPVAIVALRDDGMHVYSLQRRYSEENLAGVINELRDHEYREQTDAHRN